jgi:hypothetical protein
MIKERSTYIKPSSKTQRESRAIINDLGSNLEAIGITFEMWLPWMFECGFQSVHNSTEKPKERRQILEDQDEGFWAWWLLHFIERDNEFIEKYDAEVLRMYYFKIHREAVKDRQITFIRNNEYKV